MSGKWRSGQPSNVTSTIYMSHALIFKGNFQFSSTHLIDIDFSSYFTCVLMKIFLLYQTRVKKNYVIKFLSSIRDAKVSNENMLQVSLNFLHSLHIFTKLKFIEITHQQPWKASYAKKEKKIFANAKQWNQNIFSHFSSSFFIFFFPAIIIEKNSLRTKLLF